MYAHHMLQVVGKPEAAFFQLALSDLGVPSSAAVMVGDDVRDDVGGALACGMAGILGMYSQSHLRGGRGGGGVLRAYCGGGACLGPLTRRLYLLPGGSCSK